MYGFVGVVKICFDVIGVCVVVVVNWWWSCQPQRQWVVGGGMWFWQTILGVWMVNSFQWQCYDVCRTDVAERVWNDWLMWMFISGECAGEKCVHHSCNWLFWLDDLKIFGLGIVNVYGLFTDKICKAAMRKIWICFGSTTRSCNGSINSSTTPIEIENLLINDKKKWLEYDHYCNKRTESNIIEFEMKDDNYYAKAIQRHVNFWICNHSPCITFLCKKF